MRGVEIIGCDAFRNTALTEIVIPETTALIEKGAFSCTPNLTNVTMSSKCCVEIIGCGAFCKAAIED